MPKHVGAVALVWRFDPDLEQWGVVGMTVVHRWGRIRWSFETELADARDQPYRFRFEIPGHGMSSLAHLGVVDATE